MTRLLILLSLSMLMGCTQAIPDNTAQDLADDTDWGLRERFEAIMDHSTSARWNYNLGDYHDINGLYHTEGMTKIDGQYVVSSVGLIEAPNVCYPGEGVAYLHQFFLNDGPITPFTQEIPTTGNMYHPGGIDALSYDSPFRVYVAMSTYTPGPDAKYACKPTATIQLFDSEGSWSNVLSGTYENHLSSVMLNVYNEPSGSDYGLVSSTWSATSWEYWVGDDASNFPFNPVTTLNNEKEISFQDCMHFEGEWEDPTTIVPFLCGGPGKGVDPHVQNETEFENDVIKYPFYNNSGLALVGYSLANGQVESLKRVFIPASLYTQIGDDYKSYVLADGKTKYYPPLSYNAFFCEKAYVPTVADCTFLGTPEEASGSMPPIQYVGRMYKVSLAPAVQILDTTGACMAFAYDATQTIQVSMSPNTDCINGDAQSIWRLKPTTYIPKPNDTDDERSMFQIVVDSLPPPEGTEEDDIEYCLTAGHFLKSAFSTNCADESPRSKFYLRKDGRLWTFDHDFCLASEHGAVISIEQKDCTADDSVFRLSTSFN